MMAIILAGGKGTRLKPFTMTIPKPLLPLGDVPILEVVLRQLSNSDINRVILTLGHMAPLFQAYLGDGSKYGLDLTYLLEDEPLGTAGPLRIASNLDEFAIKAEVTTSTDGTVLVRCRLNRTVMLYLQLNRVLLWVVYPEVVVRSND